MLKKHLLIYSQDIGGAQFLLPIISQFISNLTNYESLEDNCNCLETNLVIHKNSESVFERSGLSYTSVNKIFSDSPVTSADWMEYLIRNHITHLFCTTSSSFRDLTNCNLIFAANQQGVSSLGIFDHWKGVERFFNGEGVAAYLPQRLICIDQFSKDFLRRSIGFECDISSIGHPHLEQIYRRRGRFQRRGNKQNGGTINIVLISQPDTASRHFDSVFVRRCGRTRLVDVIIEEIQKGFSERTDSYRITYRPHSKEALSTRLPDNCYIDYSKSWIETLTHNDVFIGFDSMALIEASVVGKNCISIDQPWSSTIPITTIPNENLFRIDALTTLKDIVLRMERESVSCPPLSNRLKESATRGLKSLREFLTEIPKSA